MRFVVVCVALAMLFAGCAEVPEETEDAFQEAIDESPPADGNETVEDVLALAGEVLVTMDNTTVLAGVPFNVTLDYLGEDVNLTTVAWTIEFAPAVDSNVTGNSTAEDNATAEPVGNVTTYNGTGLPATIEANLTEAGNLTVVATVMDGDLSAASEAIAMIVEVDPASLDPCIGAVAQDPFVSSGTLLPGAVGVGFYTSNPFTMGPCHTKMTIDVSTTTADVIIELVFPDGSTVDYDSAFVGGETWTYDHGGVMDAGDYSADLYAYATAVDTYDMTITFAV